MTLFPLFALLTVFGVLFALAILRADRTRWDNRVFAVMALIDAFSNGYHALRILGGHSLVDFDADVACAIAGIPMAAVSVEFAYSFPFNRPAPPRLRIPVLAAMVVMLVLELTPRFRETHQGWEALAYSGPLFVVAMVLLARNVRATTGDRTAVLLVAAGLAGRWVSAILTYGIVERFWPESRSTWVFLDATAFTLLCYMLMTLAFTRSQLFSLRGLAAELLVLASGVVGVIGIAIFAVEGAFHVATSPGALRGVLVLATFVPLAGGYVFARIGRRFEGLVARSIDPRRALREGLLERIENSREPEPLAMVRQVCAGLAELSGGRAVYLSAEGALVRGDLLPKAVAERLGDSGVLRERRADMPYDLVLAVGSQATLYGAIALDGGIIDRDTTHAATTLADRLALRLDAYTLFIELEAARRLATLGAFAAAIAHDIRTPLTSVQMNVQILRKKVKLPPDEMEYFDIALEELHRLNASISELLDFAKPAQVESSPVELGSVIADARRAIESVLVEHQVSLDVTADADTPTVLGDPTRLRNVLENLITNAANASKKGARISVRTRRADDGRGVVEVADTGRGIAPSDLPRIFEPFFTTRPDGTGLGLAICDKLVRAQRGEIRVHAALGEGATFSVLLPAASSRVQAALPAE